MSETIRHEVIATVEGLLPLVRACDAEGERQRHLSDEVERRLRSSGVNRMLLPRSLGGLEVHPLVAIEVAERLAGMAASTGWCAVIGAGSNIFAGYLPPAGAAEVFADPDRSTATMFAPLGTLEQCAGDRQRLHGRWPFVSNCHHASWIGLGARLLDGEPDPVPRLAFVRTDDVTIEDTWDVVGLRGTGSHHVTADVPVAPEHCCVFVGEPWADGPLWRMPVFSIILPMLAAVPLGIARAALDEVLRQARDGRGAVRRGDLAGDPLAMHDLADADVRLEAARLAVRDLVGTAYGLACANSPLPSRLLARIYLANLHAVDTAVYAAAVAHRLGGGGAVYAASPLLHALDDVLAARQHFQFAHEHRIALGRVLAGVDARYPPYITSRTRCRTVSGSCCPRAG